jgi:putative molybdenum carrier protein
MRPRRVVSGGQTGVDRGALDAAIAAGIPHGGWCPRGRRAEDGVVPDRYALREHTSAAYAARTEANVVDSDATLVLRRGRLAGGTALTRTLARRHGKPLLVVDLATDPDAPAVRRWIDAHRVDVLNVAGPRESEAPGIAAAAATFMQAVLGRR